ncbi:MAG: hypothetical protein JWP03_4929 [Phycisphaerales bacterium]|nr:hypothetical protein [Phycisphaerales bacterium]
MQERERTAIGSVLMMNETMIRFSCHCGHGFELADDTAGSDVQCPACGRLNDVPFMGDLSRLSGDGTYALDDQPPPTEPDRLTGLAYVFAKSKLDAEGNEIDLRNDPNEPIDASAFYRAEEAVHTNRPRYDPETGELITPIPVADDGREPRVDPATVPFAKPVITYAAAGALRPRSAGHVLLDLCQPLNGVVMFFIFFIHLTIGFFTFFAAMGIFIIAPGILAGIITVIAHYGNVIDDVGTEELDELPRPLRDLRFYEDIWMPLVGVSAAMLISYAPAWFALTDIRSDVAALAVGLPLALAGTFALPALLLTLLTSGSYSNLRPDRVLGVIRACGSRYFGVALLFLLAVIPYVWAMGGITIGAVRRAEGTVNLPMWVTNPGMITAFFVIGIFLMHLFCWHVGLLYRVNHREFPWVGRYHVRGPREEPVRKRPRYVSHLPSGPTKP